MCWQADNPAKVANTRNEIRPDSKTTPPPRGRHLNPHQAAEYFKKQLHLVDNKIFSSGMDLFENAPIMALWLCEPAPSLGGKVPLKVMRTAKGRAAVATVLARITHGCY